MPLDIFWGGAPVPQARGRDKAIAEGAELDELGYAEYEVESDEGSEPDYYNPQTGEASRKRRGHTIPNDPAKRRVPGGKAPIAKRITTDYDSDDARIIELKQQMYSDEYVANKLQEEGRIRYQAKTVGSRWIRIRRIMDERENEKLDDELTDWHEGEDTILTTIFDDLERKYEEERAKLEVKKWREVSMHLAVKLGKKKYTGKACRERYDGLQNGTALLPIELDEDQAGRRKLREDRIAATKKMRDDAAAAIKWAAEQKAERQETKKREAAEANQKRVQTALIKQTEKEERERVKEERQVNKDKARQARLRTLAQMRREREWQMAKNRAEKKLYQQLTGNAVKTNDNKPLRIKGKTKKGSYFSDDEESMIDELESDDEAEAQLGEDEDEDEDEENASAEESDLPMLDLPVRRRTSARLATPATKATPTPAPSSTAVMPAFERAQVTEETLLNPRSVLDDDELVCLLHFRNLPRREKETHAEVVARLAAADQMLKSDELDQLLAHSTIRVKGKKVDKIRRLQEADAKRSKSAELGLASTDIDFMETYGAYQNEEYRPILDRARRDSVME